MKKNSYCHVPSGGVMIKLLTIMKITLTLLLICTFSVSASVMSHAQKLTLNMENATIRQVFDEIEKQTGFKFFYIDEQVDVSRKVTLSLTNKTLEDALDELFDKKQIKYRIFENKMAVLSSAESIQQIKVNGKVVDAKTGEALPGVSVQVEGTSIGGISDVGGKFSIELSDPKATLIFSYVGYVQERVPVDGRSTIDVSLNPDVKALDEIVVVGYGTQKKQSVTNAVTSFKSDNLNERPVARIDQALVGQMTGVSVKQTTGIPGKAFSIQVRGSGSITAGNEPLYVIDGFPLTNNSSNTTNGSFTTGNPLDNINPNDISSIEVLKDASSAAIYGSRASNGVVLITTKRGKAGKVVINLNTYVGYNEASKKLNMMNGQQWIDRATEIINGNYLLDASKLYPAGTSPATVNDDNATRASVLKLASGSIVAKDMLDPRWFMPGHPGLEFVDWQDAIERKGIMMNHEISASGGNDIVRFFISGNFADQDGFIKGVGYKAYSARANVDITASKNLKFGINLAPTYSITDDPGVEGKDNIFHQALSMTPVQEDTAGLYPNIGKNGQYLWSNTTNAPLGKLKNNVNETKRYRTLGTIYAEYQLVKGLSLRSAVNADFTTSSQNVYTPYITQGTLTARTYDPVTNPNLTSSTSGSYVTYRRLTFVNENTLTYNTVIATDHSLNLLLGQSYNIDRFDNASVSSVGGYTSGVIQTLNAAANTSGTSTATQNVLLSYFSRVQYAYKDKYFLSASLRTDGSSRFGSKNQYGVFPSLSLGWQLTKENFMKSLKAVSDFKIRGSYGVNGNNNIGDYGSIPTLGSYPYVLGATQAAATGQAPNTVPNPNLQWEKSSTYDAGLDFGFLNNRITGSFDYYNKLNTKLLLNVPVLEVTGLQTALQNAGSVRNVGEELELSTRNIIGAFEWTTNINITHNTNKIVSLYGSQTQIIIPNGLDVTDCILRVGQPLNSIYVVKQIGFLTQADMDNKVALYGTGETVGDPKYQDLNGDGVITEADKQIVGHPNPDYIWGFKNTFNFKGFDLSVLIQGQNGGSIYSALGRAITRTGQGYTDNAPASLVNRWKSPTDQGEGRFSKAYSTFGFVANTDWLYSSDYIRVRNITLGYNLMKVIKKKIIQGARIYVTAENFFGRDKYYNGLNPEAANTTISSNSAYPEAEDYGGLPLAKSLIFGLNITF